MCSVFVVQDNHKNILTNTTSQSMVLLLLKCGISFTTSKDSILLPLCSIYPNFVNSCTVSVDKQCGAKGDHTEYTITLQNVKGLGMTGKVQNNKSK